MFKNTGACLQELAARPVATEGRVGVGCFWSPGMIGLVLGDFFEDYADQFN